jgi:ribosomal protein S18 acetylase RimI-like enzyme
MIAVKKLQPGDIRELTELIRLYEDVFEMENFVMPGKSYLESLLRQNGLTFLVALFDGRVAGGLTAHDLPSTYFEANEVYIYDLAVAKQYQRQGIGKKLLLELAAICKTKGEKEFFVQADFDDHNAIEFYRATGGVPEKVFHFSYNTEH